MEITSTFVFQTDSEIVNDVYSNQDNFLVEYNNEIKTDYCVIYFSSNNIYYPNTADAFKSQLLNKNKFEWYQTRINGGQKHIFLRDIKKQWYLSGINTTIDSPARLFEFLKKQTEGFRIITIGSSSGGFAAILYGQQLNAERIYSFNGQFEILSLLGKSSEAIDPLVFRNREDKLLLPYYDTLNFISNPASIYYFNSRRHPWDKAQAQYASKVNINRMIFTTGNHGIPFLKTNLPAVINMPVESLNKYNNKIFHPIVFSMRVAGLADTLEGLWTVGKYMISKFYSKIARK